MKLKSTRYQISILVALVIIVLAFLQISLTRKKYARTSRRQHPALGASVQPNHRARRYHLGFNKKSDNRKVMELCLEEPLGLKGSLAIDLDILYPIPSLKIIEANNLNLFHGGRHSPTNCQSRWNVAIIIPFRGRELQLRGLLNHMHPIWQRQKLSYTVFVIQQSGEELFNRAKLLNIGFKEASKYEKFDCFVFHDADILLENDKCLYSCHENRSEVKHLSAYLDKYDYSFRKYGIRCPPSQYPFTEIDNYGGISMMSPTQFQLVNGFSNIFWGWGGEDDDMFLRVWRKGLKVTRDTKCKYSMYDHEQEKRRNNVKHNIHNSSFLRQDFEGLNSLKYEVISRQLSPLYTNVTVNVGSPSKKMLELIRQRKHSGEPCNGNTFLDDKIIW